MNNFQIQLDRWIEREPDYFGFENYWEKVVDSFDDEFWESNEQWILESKICCSLITKCFDTEKEPIFASKLIKRAKKLYRL